MTATLGSSLEAFIREHEYRGELDTWLDKNRMWMTCTCGAVIIRALGPMPEGSGRY